jgi:hypothetical protein
MSEQKAKQMMLERHDIKNPSELFDLSDEDRKLHMNKLYGQNVNQWLLYEVDTVVIERMMKWRTRYHSKTIQSKKQ